ncbi:MAG TPA: chemotaxis protein CheW, partial [Betaproteobacteria bacterium]|nr:chemotaxis protein CheW [Betaproteobacteria bacterium]
VIVINSDERVIGMVVDAVSDVLTLKPGEVKPAPTFGSAIDTQYVTGVGTVDERMLILVDIKKLLGSGDLALLEEAAESA